MKGLIDIQAFIRIFTIHREGVGILLCVFVCVFRGWGIQCCCFANPKNMVVKIYFTYYYIKITKYIPSLVKIQSVV